ncbi:MAG: hypothetical protein GY849_20925 [Deltaproteobacteria bacterium]|nr:hypothetical protein [Deltaproteobacteria bacterium]
MLSYLWGGKKAADAKPENENPELAMREACDAHGEFTCKIDGTLEFDHFIVFRAIIIRQSNRKFTAKKAELNAKKLAAFKEKNQNEYVKIFREGQIEFQNCTIEVTKKACEWIELEQANYQLTIRQYMEDEATRKQVMQKDQEVRAALDAKEITEPEDKIIAASKFKFKRDMDMFRKLQSLKFTMAPQAQQEIQGIELSKTSDALTVEYGFDLAYLTQASRHYNLENNEELKSFRKLVIAQKESEEKAEFDRAQPPQEIIDALVADGKLIGEPQYKQDGTMTFDYFLETSKIVTRYTMKQTQAGLAEQAILRRAAIKANNEEEFQKLVLSTANWEQLTNTLIQANLYQALKVPKQVFEKSAQVYLMDPDKRTIYEEEIQALRDSLRDRPAADLTREQILDSVRKLEQAKFEAQKKMYEFVRSQRVAPQMINAVIKVEKLKADDKFFNDTGIEEEDVEPAIKKLNLEDDDEFKAIIDEFKAKSDEFLSDKKDETAAMMQKARAAQHAMEMRRRAAMEQAANKKAAAGKGAAAEGTQD